MFVMPNIMAKFPQFVFAFMPRLWQFFCETSQTGKGDNW